MDRIAPIVGLANRWFQPLTHLSNGLSEVRYLTAFSVEIYKINLIAFGLFLQASAKLDIYFVTTNFFTIFFLKDVKNLFILTLFPTLFYVKLNYPRVFPDHIFDIKAVLDDGYKSEGVFSYNLSSEMAVTGISVETFR